MLSSCSRCCVKGCLPRDDVDTSSVRQISSLTSMPRYENADKVECGHNSATMPDDNNACTVKKWCHIPPPPGLARVPSVPLFVSSYLPYGQPSSGGRTYVRLMTSVEQHTYINDVLCAARIRSIYCTQRILYSEDTAL